MHSLRSVPKATTHRPPTTRSDYHGKNLAGRPGNQAALCRLSPSPLQLQARLRIGTAHDPLEREADRVADAVMQSDRAAVQRKCAACEEENAGQLQRREAGGAGGGGAAPAIVHEALAQPGRPLDGANRAFFEPRFGQDLSGVRIHEGGAASRSAEAVNALAYTVEQQIVLGAGGADRRLLAHELAHTVQQSGEAPALRRQEKTIGGPLDLKPDPCVTILGHTVCGQQAVGLCEKHPGLPGCGLVCKAFGCSKKNEPKTKCKPGWRAATSTDYAGQCCLGDTDGPMNCCASERAASNPTPRCCKNDEVVDPGSDSCVKSSSITPLLPGGICLPGQRTASGICCVPPMVPIGSICGFPSAPPQPAPQGSGAVPSLGTLWTDTIHFRKDHPAPGETAPASMLTPAGQGELDSVQRWLTISPDLEVRVVGFASSEGDTAYNQALSERRSHFVAGLLTGHLADPIMSDGAGSGCAKLGAGLFACGASKADKGNANPEDRVVRVTFARNRLPPLAPATLTPPTMTRP